MLVQQVALPKDAAGIRLTGSGNGKESALAKLFLKPSLNIESPPAAAQQVLPGNESIVIVTNDPLCAMIFTDKNSAGNQLQYQWLFGDNPQLNTVTLAPGQKANLETDLYASIPIVGTAFHGPRLYARLFKGKYYLWCDCALVANASNIISVNTGTIAMAVADAVTVVVYRLNEGDEVIVFQQRVAGPFAAGTQINAYQIVFPDYYRVELSADDDNATPLINFTIYNNAISEILCHRAMPDLVEFANLFQSIRMIGSSSRVKNGASDQFATGWWIGDQPDAPILWTSYLRGAAGNNGYTRLSGQKGNEEMEFKKFNAYTYVKPEDNKDWEFIHPFSFNNNRQVTNVISRDMGELHYTIVYLKVGSTTAATDDPARRVQLEFNFLAEYTSDAQLPMGGVSPATADDCQRAVQILASMGNITHNPGWKEIMATIGKYVRLSAPMLALMGPYGKAASVAAAGVGEGLGIAFGPGKSRTRKTAREEDSEATGPRKLPKVEEVAPGE